MEYGVDPERAMQEGGYEVRLDKISEILSVEPRLFLEVLPGTTFNVAVKDCAPEIKKYVKFLFNTNTIPAPNNLNQKRHCYSIGKKTLYLSPGVNNDMAVVVEGEHDLLALMEQGEASVVATGSKPSGHIIEEMAEFDCLYTMFDNDEAGQNLTDLINRELPQITVYQIEYDNDYKDPDEYYRDCADPVSIEDLIQAAKPLENDGFRVMREGKTWVLAARKLRMELDNLSRSKSGEFSGTVKVIKDGQVDDVSYGIKLSKYKKYDNYALQLQAALEDIYDSGFDSRDIDELLDIFPLSRKQPEIIFMLAGKYSESDNKNATVSQITRHLGPKVLDSVLREANELENGKVEDLQNVQKMRISTFFNVPNDDAFYYFTWVRKEDDQFRKLPVLLSNHKELIQLNQLRKKDENSLLLVKQKYELPDEVRLAIVNSRISLFHRNGLLNTPMERYPRKSWVSAHSSAVSRAW
jgi:DNA primase